MRADHKDPHDLAGEYVLGTLPVAARRELEAALPADPALRTAVAQWEARLLPLTRLAEPVEPSPQLWGRIAGSIGARSQSVAVRGGASWWDRLGLWRGLAAAGFAAAAAMAVITVQEPGAPAPRYMVVLAAPDNLSPGWVLQSSDAGKLRLVPLRSTAVPPARSLQLWTKADGWTKPVSLGLVQPGKAVEVQLGDLPPLQPNQLFEITLEPEAGSPIGRPTGPILFIGRAVKMI
ncbi:anti-sigma factor [Telluria aromaticivorans]|uniref:RNA polymerase subunit sigma-70 n=1 Tax=Telluria aromaticivorans TaxID=2725995 RepID=A0A7Y2JUV9_9BURK|nr:anti-sigma factor [Telluria aromaticivorans]NNG21421.1 RNA polymerase subunit sigma-70 [Telluria aromaticivorans]